MKRLNSSYKVNPDCNNEKNAGMLYDPNQIQVTEEDFSRILADIKDKDMWETVFKSDNRTVMISKSVFYNGKKGTKKMCETGVIPYSVEEVFHAYTDKDCIQKIEKEISAITEIDYIESSAFALTVLKFQYNLPFPMSNRDFCLIHSARRYKDGYIMIRKSVKHPNCPPDKGYIRAVASGGIVFEKLGPNKTRYTQTYFTDYSGWVTSGLFNKIIQMRDNKWHDAMVWSCRVRRDKSLEEPPKKSYGIINTLLYNDDHSGAIGHM
ncbi:StAR-related lipid transfer protein [Acrasis kona]|uniref:StAR-related lipid transfer protein n=1 Tax=Acrasis kona TaxID=1008807 RepID=A0AAW2Z9N1_9EUKA